MNRTTFLTPCVKLLQDFNHEGQVVAVARLVAHAVVGTAGTVATVEFFIFEQKCRRMDKSRIHLII